MKNTALLLSLALVAGSALADERDGPSPRERGLTMKQRLEQGQGKIERSADVCVDRVDAAPPGFLGSRLGVAEPSKTVTAYLAGLELKKDQLQQIDRLRSELASQEKTVSEQMRAEAEKLKQLYMAEKRDPGQIGATLGRIFELKRKAIEARVAGENRIEALLTDEQRKRWLVLRDGEIKSWKLAVE